MITTKRGKEGKMQISYNYQFGIDQLSRKVDMLNAAEFTELFVDAHNKDYKDELLNRGKVTQATWTDDYFKDNNDQRTARLGISSSSAKIPDFLYDFQTGQLKSTGYDTDWQNELYRKANNQRHSISISGGKNGIRYSLSGGYQNQQGIMLGTDQKRINFRSNIDIDLNSKLTFGSSIAFTRTDNNEMGEGRFNASPAMAALVYLPIFKAYNDDGTPSKYEMSSYSSLYAFQSGIENPVAYALETKTSRKSTRSTYNIFGQYKILNNLSAKINLATYKYDEKYESYLPTSLTSGTLPPYSTAAITAASARSRMLLEEDYLSEFTLNFNQKISDFNVSGVGGASAQKNARDILDVNANGFTDDKIPDVVGGGADPSNFTRNGGTGKTTYSMVSAFGRLNGNYKEKYHLTATFRGDGCSLFGPTNRWGYFPSISGGWTVSKEGLYNELFGVSSTLKLRASWGLSGNNSIGTYNFQQVMGKGGVVIGNNVVTTMYPGAFRDINLGWESTSQSNLGFDLTVLKGKISVIANFYNSYTFNLLFDKSITALSGSTSMLTNLPDSKINNKGFDVQIDANLVKKKDWDLKVSGNLSVNRNKVVNLGGSATILTAGAERSYKTHITQEGQPIGMFYGFKVKGMINEQDMINLLEDDKYYNASTKKFPAGYVLKGPARSLAQTTKFQLGDLYFDDMNGDGVVDDNDKTIIGNPYPAFIYGINLSGSYKNFDLSASFNGSYGNDILDGQCYYLFNMEGSGNQYQTVNDRYRNPQSPGNGLVYRASRGGTQSNSTRLSSFYLEDGSFFRCTNITFGYTLQNLGRYTNNSVSTIRLYAALDNPFTFQKYRGYNPEVDYNNGANLTPGVDYGKYPLMKSYNFGVKVTF
jgi:TonB-linked SusC/RagA family outer membrane protein